MHELSTRSGVHASSDGIAVAEVLIADGADPNYAVPAVDYLIKSHVFGAVVPHPLPRDMPEGNRSHRNGLPFVT